MTESQPSLVRTAMGDFWNEHSHDATLEEMMLDTKAEELCKEELPEILSYLPKLDGLDVVELGAGIGRFTTHFAQKSKSVLAVDFMENFIQKNRKTNSRFQNTDFMVCDVTNLRLKANRWDLIFSNWLYMYLDTTELTGLLKNMLSWLRIDGYMFCRESCNRQSGDKKRTSNPTYYRDSLVYEAVFSTVTIPTEDGKGFYGFDTILSRSVDTYIKKKQNENQVLWLVQKVRRNKDTSNQFVAGRNPQQFQKAAMEDVLRREKIVGRGFIHSGGPSVSEEVATMLNPRKDQRVLNVSCGIGGFAIYIAKQYGVKVLATDPIATSVKIARERAKESCVSQLVEFEVGDLQRRQYQAEFFDIVVCRDPIQTFTDKELILQQYFTVLKAGGKLLMSSVQRSPIVTSEQETEIFSKASFINVSHKDLTATIVKTLEAELQTLQEMDDEISSEIMTTKKEYLANANKGHLKLGFIYAEKPSA